MEMVKGGRLKEGVLPKRKGERERERERRVNDRKGEKAAFHCSSFHLVLEVLGRN